MCPLGQNQRRPWRKWEERTSEMGEIVVLNATCTLLYPTSTPFLLLLWGACRASRLGAQALCGTAGKPPKLLVPSLPHPRDGANLSARLWGCGGANIHRCGHSAQNRASCMYVTILNIPLVSRPQPSPHFIHLISSISYTFSITPGVGP